jgi:acetyl-CoA acetyltransferase family protein
MVIIDAIRTPFSRLGTSLSPLTAADLGRHAVVSLLARTGIDPAELSEVIFGCVGQPADSANLARVIALRSGIPEEVPAATVQRNCASGMEAITTAAERIASGHGDLFIVGGVESMSRIPLFYRQKTARKLTALARARSLGQKLVATSSLRPRDFSPVVGLELGLTDPVTGLNMGETAEILAREFGISREEQDAFAAQSHQRALAHADYLSDEISSVPVHGHPVGSDNGVREDSTPERLARLRPVFDRRRGSVTAGNSSQITDGAVALLVASEEKASSLGLPTLGRLRAWAYTGCDPSRMGLGPVFAIAALLKQSGHTLAQADVIELNEAFAVQVLAVQKALSTRGFSRKVGLGGPLGEISPEQLNPSGGAIALGHPVGATGARLVQTALHQLRHRGGSHALAALCVGGGQGAALWLES